MSRRKEGRETWSRLIEWDKGQAPSERLAAQLLIHEKYESLDPSHPLGGQDGTKDLLCKKENKKLIVGCYFPRGQQLFTVIKKKFKEDLEGIEKNKTEGIVFITNQELTLGERDELKNIVNKKYEVEIYHLERVSAILSCPENYGIRLEFLDIEMTKEEQLSYMVIKDQIIHDLTNYLKQLTIKIKQVDSKDQNKSAIVVSPEYIPMYNSTLFNLNKPYHQCSYCKYGYKIAGGRMDYFSGSSATAVHSHLGTFNSLTGTKLITCPKCGNTEEHFGI